MKKRKILLLAIVLGLGLVIFSACDQKEKPLSEDFDEARVKDQSEKIIGLLNNKQTEEIKNLSSEEMKEGLTDSIFNELYELIEEAGPIDRELNIRMDMEEDEVPGEEYAVILTLVKHKEKEVIYNFAFNKNMELVGLYLQ